MAYLLRNHRQSLHCLIYIIITKNICYLLWNRGSWCSLNNIYPIFLTLCIRCTNHLCDSCDLTDVNPLFIPSLLRKIQNVDLLWRHRYKSWPPAIVTSQWPIVPAWALQSIRPTVVAVDTFLAQWNRKFITAQWSTENTYCFNFFVTSLFVF